MLSTGLILALVCAIVYTAASLFLKSAIERGATASQLALVTNLAGAVVTQPLWFFDRPEVANAPLWQPLLCSVILFAGQACTFAALSRGDVSVATPLLGTKIILVTLINAVVFGVAVSLRWWVAAALGSLAIALIAGGRSRGPARAVGITVLFSLAGATCYSMTDVLVQHWGGTFDEMVFPPVLFGVVGLMSLIYYGVLDRSAFKPGRAALPILTLGAFLFGAQIAGFFFALVLSRDATAANIVYSSRSVWSVAAAWGLGHMLKLRDLEAGHQVMFRRLVGAILLFGAIILILI